MQKSVHLCLVALVTLSELVSLVEPLSEKCCPRSEGNFKNRRENPYPINVPVYRSTGITFCSENQRCHEITSCQISSSYGALFSKSSPEYLNPPTCQVQPSDIYDRKKRETNSCDPGDGDVCCETEIYPTQYNGWNQTVDGDDVYVLCLPGSGSLCDQFQFISEGRCKPNSFCSATGQPCIQEYTVHTLLAYKPGAPFPYLSFERIPIPSYCSCKNIGG